MILGLPDSLETTIGAFTALTGRSNFAASPAASSSAVLNYVQTCKESLAKTFVLSTEPESFSSTFADFAQVSPLLFDSTRVGTLPNLLAEFRHSQTAPSKSRQYVASVVLPNDAPTISEALETAKAMFKDAFCENPSEAYLSVLLQPLAKAKQRPHSFGSDLDAENYVFFRMQSVWQDPRSDALLHAISEQYHNWLRTVAAKRSSPHPGLKFDPVRQGQDSFVYSAEMQGILTSAPHSADEGDTFDGTPR